jgi:hypothetical protein
MAYVNASKYQINHQYASAPPKVDTWWSKEAPLLQCSIKPTPQSMWCGNVRSNMSQENKVLIQISLLMMWHASTYVPMPREMWDVLPMNHYTWIVNEGSKSVTCDAMPQEFIHDEEKGIKSDDKWPSSQHPLLSSVLRQGLQCRSRLHTTRGVIRHKSN